jgi:hypothetical protein
MSLAALMATVPCSVDHNPCHYLAVLQSFPFSAEASNVFGSCFNEESCT